MNNNKFLLTLFGATGDLASRKLYPALYRLYKLGHISKHFAVIGLGRRVWTKDYYEQVVVKSISHLVDNQQEAEDFAKHFYYNPLDMTADEDYEALRALSLQLDEKYSLKGNRLFYLSVSPNFFTEVTHHIQAQQLLTTNGYNRLIIEKPFGHDYDSAVRLQNELNKAFDEKQIFRIDHYLGKEIVQSIQNLRFDNALFADKWNKESIANIQITLSEAVDVEGRGEFYDDTGATRDMVQNHVMQLLSLIAMREPEEFTAERIHYEKIEVLKNIQRYDSLAAVQENVIRGQYVASADETICNYRDEANVASDSTTDTYVAMRLKLNLPEWQGVPFYIRTGKALERKLTAIDVNFKPTQDGVAGNHLRIEIDPALGYTLWLNAKEVGYDRESVLVPLEFKLSKKDKAASPDDYERLILEAIRGDASHFAHWHEVRYAWKFITQIHSYWEELDGSDICFYTAKTTGPQEADQLVAEDGYQWQPIEEIN